MEALSDPSQRIYRLPTNASGIPLSILEPSLYRIGRCRDSTYNSHAVLQLEALYAHWPR